MAATLKLWKYISVISKLKLFTLVETSSQVLIGSVL